jgi:hypothetical protein
MLLPTSAVKTRRCAGSPARIPVERRTGSVIGNDSTDRSSHCS